MDRLWWTHLLERAWGPMTFRLIVQPVVAAFLAVQAGTRDGREGRAPFGWAIVADRARRPDLLREGSQDLAKLFILALALDAIYQLFVLRWVYPGQALLVATLLAIVPYCLARGLVTRIVRHVQRVRGSHPGEPSRSVSGLVANNSSGPDRDKFPPHSRGEP
jgi:hypothetical protein